MADGRAKFTVVELEKPTVIADLDEESAKAVGVLATHPGFQYLTAKLKLQRAVLETNLKKTRHKSIQDVEFIQSGIFWTNWLEDQVNTALKNIKRKIARPATEIEAEAFAQAKDLIEVIGQEQV